MNLCSCVSYIVFVIEYWLFISFDIWCFLCRTSVFPVCIIQSVSRKGSLKMFLRMVSGFDENKYGCLGCFCHLNIWVYCVMLAAIVFYSHILLLMTWIVLFPHSIAMYIFYICMHMFVSLVMTKQILVFSHCVFFKLVPYSVTEGEVIWKCMTLRFMEDN